MIVKDTSGAVVFSADADDVRRAAVADYYCRVVGEILRKEYPAVIWHVTVNPHVGRAGIRIPAVSMRHGMSVHLARDVQTLQETVKKVGGEMLERFRISRVTGDVSHLDGARNLRGEHIKASKGEL